MRNLSLALAFTFGMMFSALAQEENKMPIAQVIGTKSNGVILSVRKIDDSKYAVQYSYIDEKSQRFILVFKSSLESALELAYDLKLKFAIPDSCIQDDKIVDSEKSRITDYIKKAPKQSLGASPDYKIVYCVLQENEL